LIKKTEHAIVKCFFKLIFAARNKKNKIMLAAFLISAILLVAGVLLMGFKVFFTEKGKFPSTHISDNEALKKKGIHCATAQDRLEQATN
jgi:hypothetical protein